MIHLICALPCEARPLIDYYALKHVPRADLFRCYASGDDSMSLTISGIGKINAAAAVCHTYTVFNSKTGDAWLNIGMAGHGSLDIGLPILAHSIEDDGSCQRWYPQIVFTPPCRTAELKTLDRPSTDYSGTVMDMEASGFYIAASRCTTTELVQVLKIISDNALHPAAKPDPGMYTGLINNQLPCIARTIEALGTVCAVLADLQAPPPCFNECKERWHFTEFERNQLERLLRRRHLLCPGESLLAGLPQIKTGKELIRYLQKELERLPAGFAG